MSGLLLPTSKPADVQAVVTSQKTTNDASVATRGTVTPLVDGVAALKAMQEVMSTAKSYIFISAWYLHIDTKLPRGKESVRLDTLLKTLTKQGKKIFVLISYLENRPIKLGNKKFNLFQQARRASSIAAQLSRIDRNVFTLVDKHPFKVSFRGMTRILGSQHEKFIVVDGEVAFCGGMEFTRDYSASSPEHKVPRGLRHDIHLKCEGSIASHLDTHFRTRWKEVQKVRASASGKQTGSEVVLPESSKTSKKKDDHAVQIARTRSQMKKDSVNPVVSVREVFDAYLGATQEATRLIYIEQQYFRDKELAQAIANRLGKAKDLEVIILLPERPEEPPSPLTDHVNHLQFQALEIVKKSAPQRVGFYSVRKVRGSPKTSIYVHSKVMIVDDKWMTVGSANTNPRSFKVDSEVNILVRDDKAAKELRMSLWKEHLQVADADLSEASLAKGKKTPLGLWKAVAKGAYKRLDTRRRPSSRIITHVPLKGKQINLEDYGIGFLERMFVPDIDLLAVQRVVGEPFKA